MSRHRIIRNEKNLTDEFDGLDDCYGHSVEDDYCVSPSAEQFMYDRSKQANIASFITEPDIVEDVEEVEDMPSSYKVPHLSDIEAAKLMSCMETIRNVIGDTYPESELNRKIIEFKFNAEAVIDSILNDETPKDITVSGKQPLGKTFNTQPGSKFKQFFSDSASTSMLNTNSDQKVNLEKGCDKSSVGLSSLSTMFTNNAELSEKTPNPNTLSSFAGLSAFHMKLSEKKSNLPSGFSIPKVNFNNPKPSTVSRDEPAGFSSLANLTAHHLKMSSDSKPSGFVIPKLGPKDSSSNKNESTLFGSLAELTAHHLKISNDKSDSQKTLVSPSGFVIPKIGPKNNESSQNNSPSFGSLAELTAHHLKISNRPSGFVIPKKTEEENKPSLESLSSLQMHIKKEKGVGSGDNFTIPKLSIKNEKNLENSNYQNSSNTVLEDISNLCIEEKFDPNKVIKSEPINFSMQEVSVKTEKSENSHVNNELSVSLESSLKAIKNECNQFRAKAIHQRKSVSPFGKVLCKSFSRKVPYLKKTVNNPSKISPFDFSSPSPDSIVLARLRRGVIV